jgi:hypothetical protein
MMQRKQNKTAVHLLTCGSHYWCVRLISIRTNKSEEEGFSMLPPGSSLKGKDEEEKEEEEEEKEVEGGG